MSPASSATSSQSLRGSSAKAATTCPAPATASLASLDQTSVSASAAEPPVPVETLVEHLLAAKRSLSSMTLVLQANDLTTEARNLHHETTVLSARSAFMRSGIAEQILILERVRRGLGRTYDNGRHEFERLIRLLDDAGDRLSHTMDILRTTVVDPVFRPPDEGQKSLIDFVDEGQVDKLTKALKESIVELKGAETSYDGDLLRFDDDIRGVKRLFSAAPSASSPSNSIFAKPMADLVRSLTAQSHGMAENLSSLTRHFDLCVTAVRACEGGAELALRKAAEDGSSQQQHDGEAGNVVDPVSISGVMAEEEAGAGDGHPKVFSTQERDEMVKVVIQDAAEVSDVVRDMTGCLEEMEAAAALVRQQSEHMRLTHASAVAAVRFLDEVAGRLPGYVAAEREYTDRCDFERDAIAERLANVEELAVFYEGYAGAYDGLVLEYERRRAVEDKIQAVWRKAQAAVQKLEEQDAAARLSMRKDVGEFIPGDLWVSMDAPVRKWKVVPAEDAVLDDGPVDETSASSSTVQQATKSP